MEADQRFAHVATDPKFRRIPKGERKVKIDKRFQGMFKDKKFQVKYTVDKRGRPVSHSTTEDLKRYYDLESGEEESDDDNDVASEEDSEQSGDDKEEDESDEEDEESEEEQQASTVKSKKLNKKEAKQTKNKVKGAKKTNKQTVNKHATDKNVDTQIKKKLKNLTVDYARGEGNLLSGESSSDDEETDEEIQLLDDGNIDHKWGELDADAEPTQEATSRLAACNMDWDRIKASDLMVLFNSFLPPGGSIISVVIYPSEFGKKRLAEEEIKGPAELVHQRDDDDHENQEGAKYHMEKLRQYQLNRLKYYYAVVTCDSATSANKIYTECDGMEYESSATKIDLRFIPEDMTFEDAPKEECGSLPEMAKYKPRFFTTTALQQAKVDLTWDETNPDRVEIAEKLASGKIDDVADADLQNYLASSSGDESEEDSQDHKSSNDENEEKPVEVGKTKKEDMINKYKMLLQEIENKEKSKENKDIGMEITWGIDLQKKTEKIIQEKKTVAENKTPFEQFLDKRKEKRKEKREAQKNAKETNDDDTDADMPSDIDMNDSYFAEEFSKPEFEQKKEKAKTIDSDYDSESETEANERKAQLELLLNDEDDGKKHFSLKKIQDGENESKSKKKRKIKKGKDVNVGGNDAKDDFNVDVNDERFSALFTSHHFNIDPTDPHFKKTKNMEKLINEKIKRRAENDVIESGNLKKKKIDVNGKSKKTNAELNVLVKSVKRKAEAFKNSKK